MNLAISTPKFVTNVWMLPWFIFIKVPPFYRSDDLGCRPQTVQIYFKLYPIIDCNAVQFGINID